MRQSWIDGSTCYLDDIKIAVGRENFGSLKTTSDLIYVLKGKGFFDKYLELFKSRGVNPSNVLEIGIFEGGSAILFADMWEKANIVGIDIRPKNEEVIKHVERFNFSDRVKLFYGVSQDDRDKVTRIIENEMHSKIDLVVDDASHFYDLTKSTFEIVFPYLSNNGIYIIEDWGWAHWDGWQGPNYYSDKVAMSNLMFELIMVSASKPNVIAKVIIDSAMCIVEKAWNCPPLGKDFKIDDMYCSRGKKLSLI